MRELRNQERMKRPTSRPQCSVRFFFPWLRMIFFFFLVFQNFIRSTMGKLGKNARKFAKKNLQSVYKRNRKLKSMFKKRFAKSTLLLIFLCHYHFSMFRLDDAQKWQILGLSDQNSICSFVYTFGECRGFFFSFFSLFWFHFVVIVC